MSGIMTKIDIERIWKALQEEAATDSESFPVTKEQLEKAIAKVFQL